MHPTTTSRSAAALWTVLAVCGALLLAGCGDKKEKAATAAKVNKDEITVQHVNAVLQQQRNLRPEQAELASRQILERLIDQQLALQKADELKLDREPRVQQQLEAARREVLARAYLERTGEAAPKPTADEIKKYYDEKPALFRDRRIYSIQEIVVEARPEQVAELRERLGAAANINEFVDFLKSRDLRYAANQAVRSAEQLPLNSVDAIARMAPGQAMLLPHPSGVQVVVVAGSRSQPVSEEQARPAIEAYLLNDRRRKLVEDDIKALRAAATIEYAGKFGEGAASAPLPGGAVVPGVAAVPAPPASLPAAADSAASR